MLSSFQAIAQLSISSFVQQIFAIKSRSCLKPNNVKGFGPQFFGRDDPDFSTENYCLPFTVWQSLVEFCLLISVLTMKWNAEFTESG